ncbi:MAG TPA: SDR family NAD(P)-dependent oxidoreductase [Vicinamibacterales bacterium]
MELGGNVVLITGGGSGIGLGLARRFLDAGSTVIACGRREAALREAQSSHPGLHIRVADVATEDGRRELTDWVTTAFPTLNVLVNNAGIQRYPRMDRPGPWSAIDEEIAINFAAPVHLSMLLVPHLQQQPRPAIVNVTSGLSFVPLTHAPIYSATKAALHSFTLSLRHQLAATPIQVVEIIPPAVNTDLGGPGLHTFGVALDEFLDGVMPRIAAGAQEVAYGFAEQSSRASREQLDQIFERMNAAR